MRPTVVRAGIFSLHCTLTTWLWINLNNLNALGAFVADNSTQKVDRIGHIHDIRPPEQPNFPHSSSAAAVAFVHARLRERSAQRELRLAPIESLLAQYTERHLACTDHTRTPGPYLLMQTVVTAGVGNLLPGVVTGFLLALLLERCLFVRFAPFNDYFTHELNFNWTAHHQRLLSLGLDPGNPKSALHQLPRGGSEDAAEMWLFQDLTEQYGDSYGLELSQESDYNVALLQGNSHYKEFFATYFPNGEVFTSLSAFLFRLAPQFDQRIHDFRTKNFKLYNIGLQIRRAKCGSDSAQLLCVNEPTVTQYCQVAKSIQVTMGLHDDDVAFMIAADRPGIYSEAAQYLAPARVVWTDNGIAPYSMEDPATGRELEVNAAGNPGTSESAILDLALLSKCDDLVVTIASSFGWVAAAWGGIAPVQMLYGEHQHVHNPYWYRAINSEPCLWSASAFRSMDPKYKAQFQTVHLWMQYSQCHFR